MLRILARAKINWSLDILGLREDGYHRMDMLMESVELADELTLEPADTLSLAMEGGPAVPMERNLVWRAAQALSARTGYAGGAAMRLTKRTPSGAGMGGGSADAAAALAGLNSLWQTGLSRQALQEIGLSIGADVPFMLQGGLARVGGIGEEITPLPIAPVAHLVVVQPCQPLSTRGVFAAYDALAAAQHPDTGGAQAALPARDYDALARCGANVLQHAAQAARPQIGEAQAALYALGALYAAMTGSGSAVFGAFADAEAAEAAWRRLRKRWRRCWLTRTAREGVVTI